MNIAPLSGGFDQHNGDLLSPLSPLKLVHPGKTICEEVTTGDCQICKSSKWNTKIFSMNVKQNKLREDKNTE
jgi:hypothetical protein